ncbi:MAG: hypothetical protein U1E91_06255 [Moraxella sp.]
MKPGMALENGDFDRYPVPKQLRIATAHGIRLSYFVQERLSMALAMTLCAIMPSD